MHNMVLMLPHHVHVVSPEVTEQGKYLCDDITLCAFQLSAVGDIWRKFSVGRTHIPLSWHVVWVEGYGESVLKQSSYWLHEGQMCVAGLCSFLSSSTRAAMWSLCFLLLSPTLFPIRAQETWLHFRLLLTLNTLLKINKPAPHYLYPLDAETKNSSASNAASSIHRAPQHCNERILANTHPHLDSYREYNSNVSFVEDRNPKSVPSMDLLAL